MSNKYKNLIVDLTDAGIMKNNAVYNKPLTKKSKLDGIDIKKELQLIKEKKSKLPAHIRNLILMKLDKRQPF
jgi:hypothetical protein